MINSPIPSKGVNGVKLLTSYINPGINLNKILKRCYIRQVVLTLAEALKVCPDRDVSTPIFQRRFSGYHYFFFTLFYFGSVSRSYNL